MTKPQTEAERMASEFAKGYGSFDAEDDERCYLAGFKAAIEQADLLTKIMNGDRYLKYSDLKALLEAK